MAKENSIKMKREPTIWENVFTNDTSDKGLISKIYKELTQLPSRKTNNPVKKMGKGLEQTLLQGSKSRGRVEAREGGAGRKCRQLKLNNNKIKKRK